MLSDTTATLAAAGLSAFVGLMVVVVTKEQKISEFRQAWIDAFRADLAEAISTMSALSIVMQDEDGRAEPIFVSIWTTANAALARIDLRLNMKEQQHRDIESCIRDAEGLLRRLKADEGDYDPAEWRSLQDKTVTRSRGLLKHEWNRVRRGELWYRRSKMGLLATVIGVPLALGVHYLSPVEDEHLPRQEKKEPRVAQQDQRHPAPAHTSAAVVKRPIADK